MLKSIATELGDEDKVLNAGGQWTGQGTQNISRSRELAKKDAINKARRNAVQLLVESTLGIEKSKNYRGAVPDLVVVSYSEVDVNSYGGASGGAIQMVVKFKAEKNVYGGSLINDNFDFSNQTGRSQFNRNDINGVVQYSPI